MAFTAQDLTKIDEAIASGALRVRFSDGREVTYQTMDGLVQARSLITRSLSVENQQPQPRMVRVMHVRT